MRDGLLSITPGNPDTVNLDHLHIPGSGTVIAKLGLVNWEGDIGETPETVTLSGSTISDALNPANNVFNSSMSRNGSRFTAKNPDYVNQFGFDSDVFNITGVLPANGGNQTLTFSTGSEALLPGVITQAVETAGGSPPTNTAPPTVSGTAQEASTLTTTNGTWTGSAPITFAYLWVRCDTGGINCLVIADATNSTYNLVPADVGSTIRSVVEAINPAGDTYAWSSQTAVVTARPPVNTAVPTISGTQQEGSSLTASDGTWTGTAPITFTYQWLRCDSERRQLLEHRQRDEPELRAGPGRHRLHGSRPRHRHQRGRQLIRPVEPDVGDHRAAARQHRGAHRLRHRPGGLDPDRRQRHLDGHRPDQLHLPVAALRFERARTARTSPARRTAPTRSSRPTSARRFASRSRAPTLPATPRHRATRRPSSRPATRSTPSRRRSPVLHRKLRRSPPTTAPGPEPPRSPSRTSGCAAIRAGANCSNIASATNNTYDLVPADVGATIRVRVTGTNVGGNSSAKSSQTSVVTARNPVNTALPTVSGTAQEASTLTAIKRHLDRNGTDHLHLPVAALRLLGRQLLEHRRRHQQHLRPRARRRRARRSASG